ncbi:hypothetical protein GXW71_17150 [Roseomonas hellenica]|uniref:DUF3739 domain-containing protein n=1 Tax=Plastoroseomonas hellenica TaxID=2687306 RepID=A0ABS5F1U5_9PROT|nr:hypothetical protein [Plastoroseomonas hellenica]MBR0666090.1 hypothetical protein [Plastoroseomonas hellenica]
MTSVPSGIPPFYAGYQPGYVANGSGSASGGATPGVADIVDVRAPLPSGSFTAEAGDSFSVHELFSAGAKAWDTVERYRVALRDDPVAGGGGRLMLNGQDVTDQVDFSPLEFNSLLYVAGPHGTKQDLVVVARAGTPVLGGGLTNIVDSPAVQISANVTGSRSINAASALRTQPGADEANFIKIAQDANLYTGISSTKRPAVTTVGNFTAEAGDSFSMHELFDAGPKAWDTVERYRVALRDDPAAGGGGRLMLNGQDVTDQVDFSPLEFNSLLYVAGPNGTKQDIVVVARAGTPELGGGLTDIVDSPAVQISAEVTGSRSINAASALRTQPGADEANFIKIAQDAELYTGISSTKRPAVTTVGDFTAEAGDSFSVHELFDAGPSAWDSVERYRVALRDDPAAGGGGRLMLNGQDVTDQVDFSPLEFNSLLYVAGPNGTKQDIVVVARAGTPELGGGLTDIVDSPAVQITAGVTGSRSINAASALRTQPGADEANFVKIVQDANLFTGISTTTRPALTTVGNFTAEAGDSFSVHELFDAGAKAWDSVERYRVALRDDPVAGGGGRLMLNGQDVTGQIDFSPLEFNSLLYVAGPNGTKQDLVVVARAGTPELGGGLTDIVDSPAVQISANVTGSRSINAASALRTQPGADEANVLKIVQDANLFTGISGTTRPALTTVGNFTAEAGDNFSVHELFSAGAKAWDTVERYRVALRDDPVAGGGGRLMLNGQDVTGQVDFSPLEFNSLLYVAGPNGTKQDIVVVARAGTPELGGGLTNIIDSPAVQISANVTGSRSINAASALRTEPGADEADFLRVVRDAALYTGLSGATRPAVTTIGQPDAPTVPLDALADAIGAFRMAGGTTGAAALQPSSGQTYTLADLAALYPGAVGGSRTGAAATTNPALTALAMLLDTDAIGMHQSAGDRRARQSVALQAYLKTS